MKRREAEARIEAVAKELGLPSDAKMLELEPRYIEVEQRRLALAWVATFGRQLSLRDIAVDYRSGRLIRDRQ